jgi:hypothetical protein
MASLVMIAIFLNDVKRTSVARNVLQRNVFRHMICLPRLTFSWIYPVEKVIRESNMELSPHFAAVGRVCVWLIWNRNGRKEFTQLTKKRRQTHRTHYCDTKTKQLLWYIWTSIHGSLMVWHHQRRYLQSAFPPYQISKTGMVALRTMSSLIASLAKIQ